jgi:type VI secretion system VasD/TssJ family lipoprotein
MMTRKYLEKVRGYPKAGVRWAAALVYLLSVHSCAHKPDPAPSWNFEPGAIKISYTADKLLNRVGDKSHTLLLTVHQLNDPNGFKKLAQYEEGLRRLLEARNLDSTTTAVKKVFVEPGESNTIVLDRAENTKWIGVAAGYYSLDPGRVVRVFEIPHVVESKGFISKERVARIPPLHLELVLGPESVQEKKPESSQEKKKK